MDLVVVAGPLDLLDPAVSTTLGIVAAALDRGHHVRACLPSDLAIVDGAAVARTYDVRRGDTRSTLLGDADAILLRQESYAAPDDAHAARVIGRVDTTRTLLVNDPRGVRFACEGAWGRDHPDLCPPARATALTGRRKRLFVHGGEPVAAALHPHVGPTARMVDVDDRDREVCDRLGPELRAQGLYLVGLDLVDGWLTGVDVTGSDLRACDRLLGSTLCADLVDLMAATLARVGA